MFAQQGSFSGAQKTAPAEEPVSAIPDSSNEFVKIGPQNNLWYADIDVRGLNIIIQRDKFKVSWTLTMPKKFEMGIFFWRPFIVCMNLNNLVSKSLNRNIAYHNILWYRPPDIVSRYWQVSITPSFPCSNASNYYIVVLFGKFLTLRAKPYKHKRNFLTKHLMLRGAKRYISSLFGHCWSHSEQTPIQNS